MSTADVVQEEYRGGFATSVILSGMYEDDRDSDGGTAQAPAPNG